MCRKNILKYLGTAGVAVVLFITHLAAADTYDVERTNPINILFDSKGTQTLINNSTNTPTLATNSRLATILAALSNYGQNSSNTVNGITNVDTSFPKYIISYTSNNEITDELLANKDVYISLTRGPSVTNSEGTTNAYTTNELIALKKFVEVDGKGILLHANHGPNKKYPKVYDDDYTYNNISLATNFNIELRPYIVFGKKENGYMMMSVNTNSTGQELEFISHQALTIASHDSCIIVPHTNYISIAKFPTDALIAKYKGTNNPVPQQLLRKSSESRHTDFAILVHAGKGRVIIVGNSGMIADYGSPSPSFGLVPMQSNLMFFLNCVSYLAGIVNIPPAGEGPGYPGKIIP